MKKLFIENTKIFFECDIRCRIQHLSYCQQAEVSV